MPQQNDTISSPCAISRRQLIVASAALGASTMVSAAQASLASCALSGEQPASPPPTSAPLATPTPAPTGQSPKRTLKAAVMYGMIGEGTTPLEKFQVIKDCGFEGVEIDAPSNISNESLLAAAAKTGITMHGVVHSGHWKYPLNSPGAKVRAQGLAMLEQALRDAKALGASSVLLVPAVVTAKQPYDQAWEYSSQAITTALKTAEECNIQIAIENVWNNFLLSPLEAARFVDSFKSPLVKWHFDIGNCINAGFPDQWIKILGPRIVKIHIKDYSRKIRDDQGLWKGFNAELGSGDAGWPEVMKELDSIGYSTNPVGNWATAEVPGGDSARLKVIREQMEKIFVI